MKVLHLIPAAFDYFADIEAGAFRLVEELSKLGVGAEAFTVQFAKPPREVTREKAPPGLPPPHYRGAVTVSEVETRLAEFDLLHVHTPLFGAAGRVLRWQQQHPQLPLVVTWHRALPTPDAFALLIKIYNLYYLPKLFAAAAVIACPSRQVFGNYFWQRAGRYQNKIQEINETPPFGVGEPEAESELPLAGPERLAYRYFLVYTDLVEKGQQ
ncbi:MAG: glycosyltransferase [Candidatus Magasanikbacteria bacterium]|nr:glycosyltransferase [Candidatus Magasanikbacteria bacterium]